MGRHTPSTAEKSFLNALLSDGESLSKHAVDLSPETADALGVKTVSPSILNNLEAQAGGEAPAPQETTPEPEVEAESEEEGAQPQGRAAIYEPSPQDYLEDEPPDEDAIQLERLSPVDEPVEEELPPEPELPTRATHGKLFSNRRAHPLELFETLNMRYGEDWADWEPETLEWAIRRDFGSIGEITRNKIQALVVAAKTDTPWLDWDTFENCGLAWNDIVPIIGAFQPMTPMQTAFTVHILSSIREEEYAHEVKAYIAAILDDHGFAYAPEEWFDGAQEILLREPEFFGFKAEVEGAWERIKDVPPEEIEWNGEDALSVHLLKLAVIKRYLQERESMRDQIPGMQRLSTTTAPPVP